jgi:hypothetical protein
VIAPLAEQTIVRVRPRRPRAGRRKLERSVQTTSRFKSRGGPGFTRPLIAASGSPLDYLPTGRRRGTARPSNCIASSQEGRDGISISMWPGEGTLLIECCSRYVSYDLLRKLSAPRRNSTLRASRLIRLTMVDRRITFAAEEPRPPSLRAVADPDCESNE